MGATIEIAETTMTGSLSVRLRAEAEQLGAARRVSRRFATSMGGDPDLVDDLELVVSELATNVVRHTASDEISLTLVRRAGSWVVEVADAELLDLDDAPRRPAPDRIDGRGLFIVDALMDRLELVERDGATSVRAVRSDAADVAGREPGA